MVCRAPKNLRKEVTQKRKPSTIVADISSHQPGTWMKVWGLGYITEKVYLVNPGSFRIFRLRKCLEIWVVVKIMVPFGYPKS